ncbi:MAG: Dihydrolipoyllysine-residue acetyltransferase component of pyruvate dehydrogenase complex [Chloroflexi bacterium ADurb.Bin325]|nr:MAG: Dihydrolipoyllysine-residue acetyltransferase component of pyruvate dehydrogenase complex [Chloroflexi bacterium ADurb.Bin325]
MAPKTTEVYIPKYGQTVEEVKIVQWLAEDGDEIKKGQEILEIETDKTTFFVEAEGAGFLHRGPYEVGQTVPVLEVVALIGAKDLQFKAGAIGAEEAPATESAEAAEEAQAAETQEKVSAASEPSAAPSKTFASPRARKLAGERQVDLAQVTPTGGGGVRVTEKDVLAYLAAAPKATPLAEKLAAEIGVDLRQLTGTGPGGKITREDVEAARAAAEAPAVVARPAPVAPAPTALPVADVAERIPLKGVRAIIVDRMAASVHTTARVTLVTEADATEFVAMRERLKARVSEEWGFAPGYNDLLALIVAKALRKFPYMNARLAADAIELLGHVNLGMAVDTERGLLVPVIRDADTKTLQQFGAEFRNLVDRARKGRSLPDDLSGGTFTITNLGMHDIDAFTPVINLPEAAILGVGRIAPKWVYRPESPNAPVLRQMVTFSLVFDHRIIDGAPAARFLQYIKGLVEEPYLLMA